jgi:hypothetical protein
MNILFKMQLLNYKDFVRYGSTFIETGSAAGDGIQRALDAGFAEVHSIEAATYWYDLCLDRFKFNMAVELHLGKSTDVLGTDFLGGKVDGLVFFLDAHPSGPLSAGHADVMEKGFASEFNQDNIIKAELAIILEKYKDAVIMIDDQAGLDDYSQEYIEIILKANPGYRFEFYDENLSGEHLYTHKILVAIPARSAE